MKYTQSEIIEIITPIMVNYPVLRGAIFGSYARNEQLENSSDLDLLLELGVDDNHTCVDYVYEMLDIIESKTKLHVDFITTKALKANPSIRFRESIEKDCRWFYEI